MKIMHIDNWNHSSDKIGSGFKKKIDIEKFTSI